jgi:hypothetical protein
MWGKGFHNKPLKHKCLPGTNQATIYFAMTRLADFENIGNPQSATTYYYTSPFPFTPYPWSVDEAGANPLRAATGHSPLPGNFVDFSVGWIELDGVASDLSSGPSFGAARGLWVLLGHLTGSGGVLAYFSEKPWGPWTDPQVIFTDEQGYYPDDSYPYPTQGFIHDEGSNDGGNAICGPYPGPLRTEAEIHGAAYSPNFIEAYSILTPLYLPDGQVDGTFLRIMYTVSTWVPYYTVLMTADFFLSPSLVQWPKPAPVVKPGHPLPRVGKGGSIALLSECDPSAVVSEPTPRDDAERRRRGTTRRAAPCPTGLRPVRHHRLRRDPRKP